MDEQQDQVQVGAGLQESRLNTDLINWLEKWGTHILTVVALIVLAYVGLDYYGKWQDDRRDAAFQSYETARGTRGPDGVLTGSPDNLVLVAQDHDGRASVYELAKIDAAEIWLGAAVRGLAPGTDLNNITEQDALNDDQIDRFLNNAETHFNDVLSRAQGDDDLILFELRALDGLAAVAESKGLTDEARQYLERLKQRAEGKYQRTVLTAEAMLQSMDDVTREVALVSESELPASAQPPNIGDVQTAPGAAQPSIQQIPNPLQNQDQDQGVRPEDLFEPIEQQDDETDGMNGGHSGG